MIIPNSFNKAIKETFYDKVITKCTLAPKDDGQGFKYQQATATANTFNGNVQFKDLGILQRDYGIADAIDIAITTDESISAGAVLKYGNVFYKVIKAIPKDSHNLLIGNLYDNRS
jgi:hypothetical protein